MSPNPTGRCHTHEGDAFLVVARAFNAPIEDVWASVTDPERTARWFGPWSGDPASGRIAVTMLVEEGAPSMEARVLECVPPRRLVLETGDGADAWHLELDLIQCELSQVTVELSHRLDDPELASQAGPGWEFYLDRLVAAESGGDPSAVEFEAYYPSQAGYYRALFTA